MSGLPAFSDLIGYPVEVQLVKGGVGPSSLTGNLYTVDPASNDLIIITFNADKKPETMKWLPCHAVSHVAEVNPSTFGCHPKSIELDEIMQNLFKELKQADPADSEQRKANLVTWLKRNHVEVKVDGQSLLIFGCVRVEPPFTSSDCYCDNAIVLRRVRAMIDKCPS